MDLHVWKPLSPDGRARYLTYSFGFGLANTLAAQLDDGTWLVVSPGSGLPDACLDALANEGGVSALLAPNAYHNLGQKAWRARFPDAKSYASAGALPRLTKKCAGVPFLDVTELVPRLGDRVRVHLPDGMKAPDLLLDVKAPDGAVWFSGDLISNTSDADTAWPARVLFGLLGGGSGYRFNPVPSMVYLSDKGQFKASCRALFQGAPPSCVLPAHGDPVTANVAAATQAILA